ncbi:response regulator transcription factor [Clostridium sp. DL1XJH146]
MIRVIIADDQVLLRESIGYILNNDDEIDVIAMAGTGKEIIGLCRKYTPDIILMDIEMPELDGTSAAKVIKEQHPDIKIIMLTTFENPDSIMQSFMAGVDGYVVKDINHYELVLTVKCVAAGLTVIDESVKKIMIDKFKIQHSYKFNYSDKLSHKDIEIIKLIAKGKSNKEIATYLNYSEGTIKNNVSKVFGKLEVTDRMQVAIFAIENGIL